LDAREGSRRTHRTHDHTYGHGGRSPCGSSSTGASPAEHDPSEVPREWKFLGRVTRVGWKFLGRVTRVSKSTFQKLKLTAQKPQRRRRRGRQDRTGQKKTRTGQRFPKKPDLILAWGWYGLTPTILSIKSKSTKSTKSGQDRRELSCRKQGFEPKTYRLKWHVPTTEPISHLRKLPVIDCEVDFCYLTPRNNPWPSGVKQVFVQLEGRISNGRKIVPPRIENRDPCGLAGHQRSRSAADSRPPVLSQDTGQDKDRPKARDKDRGSLSRPSSPSLKSLSKGECQMS